METLDRAAPTEYAHTRMVGQAGMMRAPPPTAAEVEEVNYGVDIARLVGDAGVGRDLTLIHTILRRPSLAEREPWMHALERTERKIEADEDRELGEDAGR